MPLRRIAAATSLMTLVVSAAFAFREIRVANPVKIEFEHSDFKIESTYMPRSTAFHLSIYGFQFVEQRERKSPDDGLGVLKREDPYRTTLRIHEEGQEFSKPTVLNAVAFRAVSQKPIRIGLAMEPTEVNDISAACKPSHNIGKFAECHAVLTTDNEQLSFCPTSKGVWPLEITYVDPSSRKHLRVFSLVHCFQVSTDGPLDIASKDGFETTGQFELQVVGDTPFITNSTPEPILVNQIPLDLKKRLVSDLKIRTGKDWDEERSYLSWSLRATPGTSRKYRFTASAPNVSFLAANDEQVLKAEVNQDIESHISAIPIQDISRRMRLVPFSVHDRLQSSDLSGVIISSKNLSGVTKVKFRTGLLVPAIKDFLEQKEPLHRQDMLLRVCGEMLRFVNDKSPSGKEVQKIEPAQLVSLLFRKASQRNRYKHKATEPFWKIQTIEFEPYIERAASNEKDSEISEALTEMLSSLRQQGDSSFEIPSVTADEKYPVVMGLDFPAKTDIGVYHGTVTIKGKNFDDVEVPIDFEIYDPWTKRWSAIWEFCRIPLGAIAGALAGLWFGSRKERKKAFRGEPRTGETNTAAAVTPTVAGDPGRRQKQQEQSPRELVRQTEANAHRPAQRRT